MTIPQPEVALSSTAAIGAPDYSDDGSCNTSALNASFRPTGPAVTSSSNSYASTRPVPPASLMEHGARADNPRRHSNHRGRKGVQSCK
jgi:hypothetical protein